MGKIFIDISRTTFGDIPKWNRVPIIWDGGSTWKKKKKRWVFPLHKQGEEVGIMGPLMGVLSCICESK